MGAGTGLLYNGQWAAAFIAPEGGAFELIPNLEKDSHSETGRRVWHRAETNFIFPL